MVALPSNLGPCRRPECIDRWIAVAGELIGADDAAPLGVWTLRPGWTNAEMKMDIQFKISSIFMRLVNRNKDMEEALRIHDQP